MDTYSIALRLRCVTYEDAYIAVPVTDAFLKKAKDGSLQLDFDAVMAEGIRIGQDARIEWQVESSEIEVHPIQGPLPEGRKSLDTYYDDPIHE